MTDSFVDRVKGFFLTPVEAFAKAKGDDAGSVLTYLAILVAIDAILSAIVSVFLIAATPAYAKVLGGITGPVFIFLFVLVGEFIITLIFGAWLHLWVYVFGGRKGIMETLKATIYSSTPRLILGWIPYLGIIFSLWSLVLCVIGVRDLHEMPPVKAVLAVAVAILIPLIIIVLLAAYLLTAVVAGGSLPEPVPVATGL